MWTGDTCTVMRSLLKFSKNPTPWISYSSYCIQFAWQAVEQEKLLDESARELEETIAREESLRKRLEAKEAERLDIEEKYSSLQEEAAGKTRKLKKVWGMYQVRQVLRAIRGY